MAPPFKHKARFVVKANMQRERVDFGETYAPTISNESLRRLLGLSASFGFCLHKLDVDTAFYMAT
jgi:Reverse transcriptase (RNA-dependent DNA polymerase)